ncbi:MAG: hypothetical protein AAFQ65_16160 [Myxococcota bacterium]
MNTMTRAALLIGLGFTMFGSEAFAYPTDQVEQERTGIRRLKWQHDVDAGERRGRKVPPGAQWDSSRIQLKMTDNSDFALTPETAPDTELQKELEALLKRGRWRRYNVAILDITDPSAPRFAGVDATEQQTPGSVAKVLVGAGFLNELARRYPDDIPAREKLLREHKVPADDWAMPNHHEVPVIKGERTSIRSVKWGDTFTLWEWLDHALSPSSNASASMVWREATLMRLMGEDYPPEKYGKELYRRWDREQWTEAARATLTDPVVAAGLDPEAFFLQMFFTKGANRYVKTGPSRASPLGVLAWMVKVEQGKMVDEWASAELKRMLYLTRRRVRYLYTKKLDEHAAFFKSGSLFQCKPEPGYTCIQYQGNVINVLNALIEIETAPPKPPEEPAQTQGAAEAAVESKSKSAPTPTGTKVQPAAAPPAKTKIALEATDAREGKDSPPPSRQKDSSPSLAESPPYVYIVAVMSNELKRNAATDHARLAEAIHEVITKQP